MKLPGLITRRRFRFLTSNRTRQSVMWVSLACALVVTIVAVLSNWRQAEFSTVLGNPEVLIAVFDGSLYLEVKHETYRSLRLPEFCDVYWYESSSIMPPSAMPEWMGYWDPGIVWYFLFQLPLWLAILVFLLPGLLIRYTGRAKPWQCPKCRYDLRGLDGGVCPECGAKNAVGNNH